MSDTQQGSATPRENGPESADTKDSTTDSGGADERRKPQIGDTRAAPPPPAEDRQRQRGRGRGGQGRKAEKSEKAEKADKPETADKPDGGDGKGRSRRRRRGKRKGAQNPVEIRTDIDAVELDEEQLEARRGKHRNGQPVGRYLMAVHKTDRATQIAVLEGRNLIEHYVAHPADDVSQIHGNIYLAKVANVLPGMEAAFVDIGTPKNAVLYRSDVSYDPDDVEGGGKPRIEDVLKAKQAIICQVTKNPIGVKGARLTQEVSLPGRFVVLVPNSSTYGISKRLPDNERKRLRKILDSAKPEQHGVIVRTAAEGVTSEEIANDVQRLVALWDKIEALAEDSQAPALLYREPDMAVRVIREEFSNDYRAVVIDDRELFDDAHGYVSGITPALADRVQFYDTENEKLPLFERRPRAAPPGPARCGCPRSLIIHR